MGQPPGIFINYQVQYQFPRQQPGQQAQLQAQPLHPIPAFPGFPGPGGVWQPWPAAEALADPIQAEMPETRALNTGPSPTPTVPHDIQNSSASTPILSPTEVPRSETSLPISEERTVRAPRDAAALAALNQLHGKRSPEIVEPASSSSQMGSVQSTSSADSSQRESSNPSVTAVQTVPHLIPLYDFRSSSSPFATPLQRETAPLQTARASNRNPAHRRAQDFSSHSSTAPLQPQQQHSSALPQLPPNLTDEQLANLDRLTRESIDERLRILEGVSGAVYRCIDDLMRLRSAIPPTAIDAVPSEAVHLPYSSTNQREPSSTIGTEIKDPVTRRGKEKMQESGDIESTAVGSTSTKDDPPNQSSETDI